MPVFYEEDKDKILILFAVTMFFSFLSIPLGIAMEYLHYSSRYATMSMQYELQADDIGVFLLGFGTGLTMISCIAHTYANCRSIISSQA
ncbi:hypothetical protein AVEN_109089-1 [Araneus ventricosus]|uniref:Uncharacterized protein n=1 Tax=Araneus ventricosus TaxID=182803 RepID=A0A4Y2IAG6_ARAVE|nr:hypothetical protein AVEN_109089-1 [Araneus ventricosus]